MWLIPGKWPYKGRLPADGDILRISRMQLDIKNRWQASLDATDLARSASGIKVDLETLSPTLRNCRKLMPLDLTRRFG